MLYGAFKLAGQGVEVADGTSLSTAITGLSLRCWTNTRTYHSTS